jgi:hypothetical protein
MSGPERSPIENEPLRTPGQPPEEQRRALLEDKFETPALLAAFVVALALIERFRRFRILPPQPWLMTACAVGILGVAAWRLGQIRPKLKRLREGIDGEKAVGQ